MKPTLIVGGGFSGLVLADMLLDKGKNVIVVEKERTLGGLGKSYDYRGYKFDVGPHMFFIADEAFGKLINDVLGDGIIKLKGYSGVWLFGRYFDWPLRVDVVLNLPPRIILGVLKDLIYRKKFSGDDFRAYMLNKYGRTLYDVDFKPYTEKFLGLKCDELHSDWAKAGVNRQTISKARVDSLFSLMKATFKPSTIDLYHAKHGNGELIEKLALRIRKKGGKILTGATISKVQFSKDAVAAVNLKGKTVPVERLVWTAPFSEIFPLFGMDTPQLSYLNLILFNIELNSSPKLDYEWTYYPPSDIIFNRVTNVPLFGDNLAPPGKGALCVEVSCLPTDPIWNNPQKILKKVVDDLIKVRFVGAASQIKAVHIEKIEHAYPLYKLDYRETLHACQAKLSKYNNLHMAGRSGTFWYANMHHLYPELRKLAEELS
ncbi:MAG: FAD-dependent oxidoreductase [archaeon]